MWAHQKDIQFIDTLNGEIDSVLRRLPITKPIASKSEKSPRKSVVSGVQTGEEQAFLHPLRRALFAGEEENPEFRFPLLVPIDFHKIQPAVVGAPKA